MATSGDFNLAVDRSGEQVLCRGSVNQPDLRRSMTSGAQAGRCCICSERALSRQPVVMRTRRPRPATAPRSAFAGFCFPPDVIVLAVRWYLRFGRSFRDVEELLAERGIQVDHVTVCCWVQRFTPLLAEAARPCRHPVGNRWQMDETNVEVAGRWRYVYRAIDQFGQVIDVFGSPRRDRRAARRFFEQAIGTTKTIPSEVVTDQAPTYSVVLEELLPAAWHHTEQHANRVEADHGRLKARLRPMRGLKQDRSARVVIAGHALVQNVRRGTTSWRSRRQCPGAWRSRLTSSC
jgi:transposase-like protein